MPIKIRHSVSLSELPSSLPISGTVLGKLWWDKTSLKKRIQFVLDILCEHSSHVHIQFANSIDIGALNWQFRGKDSPTDVLSFTPHASALWMNEDSSSNQAPRMNLGELVVCPEVCLEQSKRHRCSLAAELERMVVHGIIHLKGFDHERSSASYLVMNSLETSIRRQLRDEMGSPEFCELSVVERKTRRREGQK